MTPKQFQKLLMDLMRKGVRPEMFLEGGRVWFDLNTGMKSHLHISYDKGTVVYHGRYGVTGTISDWDALILVVRNCDYGRGFASYPWHYILNDDSEPDSREDEDWFFHPNDGD